MAIKTITPAELAVLLSEDATVDLIDVRTPMEYAGVHIESARNIPLSELDPEALKRERNGSGESPMYVVCQSGSRARQACERLCTAGVAAVNVEGGTPACERSGIAVVRGRQVMSLERQVRIAAGLLVATGTVLAATASPWFLIVPGFVGCGLIFAGVTDWCGMGLLLAKMPWNRT